MLENTVIRSFARVLKEYAFKRKWRRLNPHNETVPVKVFPPSVVKVGKGTYGELNVETFSDKGKLYLGNYISIARNVTFLLDTEHYINTISTYPFRAKVLQTKIQESFAKNDIIVDDDVWFGYGATILSGVHIGQGAVIAAGAVVTTDVPPYAIVGGIPARIIKYRFAQQLINELLKVDYSVLSKKMIIEHQDELYVELTDKKQLEWLPKR